MEKDFVPYELAVKLKTLGFDKPCFGYYDLDGLQVNTHHWYPQNKNSSFPLPHTTNNPKISAPTFSQAFRWFRVTYRYFHSIRIGVNGFTYQISNMFDSSNPDKVFDFGEANIYSSTCTSGEGWYETFEEAELACLTKLIEIVETKSE